MNGLPKDKGKPGTDAKSSLEMKLEAARNTANDIKTKPHGAVAKERQEHDIEPVNSKPSNLKANLAKVLEEGHASGHDLSELLKRGKSNSFTAKSQQPKIKNKPVNPLEF